MGTFKVPLHLNGLNRVKVNLRTCDKGRAMVMTTFAFIIAIDGKTLFPHTENYHAQETSSLTREIRDDKGGKTTREGSRGIQDFS